MKIDIIIPRLGESIVEATIVRWLVKPGDHVEKDQTIMEISTEKVDSEIPSPAAGIIDDLLFREGDVVKVTDVVARIDTDAAPASPAPKAEVPASKERPGPERQTAASFSPLVKALAEKNGLTLEDLSGVTGSGQSGKVTKQDVLKYIEKREGAAKPAQLPTPPGHNRTTSSREGGTPEIIGGIDWGTGSTQMIAMDAMRQAIAEHMVRSKRTSPHVYSIQDVDVTAAVRWRDANKAFFEKKEGFKLSVTPLFLEAAIEGLLAFPHLNSSVEGANIVLKRQINLGCAVALPDGGLIVPVIKHADEKNLVGLARALHDLSERARTKKLIPDDVAGGTFTVTNPGMFGTLIGTPIINQPQVAILCIGAIQKRPVVVDDMIAIRQMCYITLSYDHRVIDGAISGRFLSALKEHLEGWDPEKALY